jgi:hypothetical protein
LDQIAEALYASNTYVQLADPSTGRYWDSLSELEDMFLAELS